MLEEHCNWWTDLPQLAFHGITGFVEDEHKVGDCVRWKRVSFLKVNIINIGNSLKSDKTVTSSSDGVSD
jgi:hypothetical protein